MSRSEFLTSPFEVPGEAVNKRSTPRYFLIARLDHRSAEAATWADGTTIKGAIPGAENLRKPKFREKGETMRKLSKT